MNGKKGFRRRKLRVLLKALLVFVFCFLMMYIIVSLSVSDSHFIRFMSAGFFIGLLPAASLFVIYVVRKCKEIDHEAHYEAVKNQKSKIHNGLSECQSCGNRQVAEAAKNCHICGTAFSNRMV